MGSYGEKSYLFDGRLTVLLPDSFRTMEGGREQLMYPYEDRPQIILEDADTCRFCTFSLLKEQKLAGIQVKNVIQSITKAVVSLYPSCLLSKPRLVKRGEETCGWFSFRTSAKEGELRNFMYVFPVDNCMMLGTMGCFMEDRAGKEQLMKIMESLEIPEKKSAYSRVSSGHSVR